MRNTLDELIKLAIEEDVGPGDITTEAIVPSDMQGSAQIKAKEDIVVAGLVVAEKVFKKIDKDLTWAPKCEDGDFLEDGNVLAEVSGSFASLLTAERIALNFLQHLSGIATFTKIFSESVKDTKTKILDTRKTRPGYRMLEKDAVRLGDGANHRMGLHDRYLIKNNHISAAASLASAVKLAQEKRKEGVLIEVEVRNLEQMKNAIGLGVDIIMLDNFSPPEVRNAVKAAEGKVKLEVSGNISLDNIQDYSTTGVDFISIGAITHSAPAADIHMLIDKV